MLLDQDRRPRLTWRILLAWLGFFGCVLIVGVIAQEATAWLSPVISHGGRRCGHHGERAGPGVPAAAAR